MTRKFVPLAVALVAVLIAAPEPIRTPPRPVGELPTPRTVPDTAKFSPKLEAVAETKLLMEGIHQANYRGLERLLGTRPADDDTWRFVRGQALLIAEGGNLLMLRPPRTGGQEDWMRRSTELRESAAALGRLAAAKDYAGSVTALGTVANACNKCHQTFRVPTKIGPAAKPNDRDTE